jgi:two-component system, NarL family, invasion response regulator UvrY
MTAPAIRVVLVDDHAVVREGYRRLLERAGDIVVTGEAGDADGAVAIAGVLRPDVVVLDVALPGASGIDALRRLRDAGSSARVLMFSMYEDAIYATRALRDGAAGYVTKASAPTVLVEAVRQVAAGHAYLSPDVAATLARRHAVPDPAGPDGLSARELEVLDLLARGLTVRDIALRLGVSPKTVANHQSSLRQKTGAATAVQLLRVAQRLGLALDD